MLGRKKSVHFCAFQTLFYSIWISQMPLWLWTLLFPVTHLLQLKRVLYKQQIVFWKQKGTLFLPDLLSKSSTTQDMLHATMVLFTLQTGRWDWGHLTYVYDAEGGKKSVGVCLPIHGHIALPVLACWSTLHLLPRLLAMPPSYFVTLLHEALPDN